jgi:hypothetical protein
LFFVINKGHFVIAFLISVPEVDILDLPLHVHSVPITTKVVSVNPVHDEVYMITHYVIKFECNVINMSGEHKSNCHCLPTVRLIKQITP